MKKQVYLHPGFPPPKEKNEWYKNYYFVAFACLLGFVALGIGVVTFWGEDKWNIIVAVIVTGVLVGGAAYEKGKENGRYEERERERKRSELYK